jgi:uncharacterized protein involved in response to NO
MTTKRSGIPRYRPVEGPALFRQGFRPFFLGAGLWAFLVLVLWLSALAGVLAVPTAFDPVAWHAHELIFGFAVASISGFLLTAIPNWTGRMPLQGLPLAGLFGIWLAGRAAMATSAVIGATPSAAVDLSFLAALLAVVLREIVSGRNWRNLPMPAALGVLILANLLTHLEAVGHAMTGAIGQRLGIATIIMLISLIGGRVIPSFTRNWLMKCAETRLPAGFGRFDRLCLGFTAAALGVWIAGLEGPALGILAGAAGIGNFIRLARWRGHHVLSEPLVWSLHLGFLWVPVGLCLLGLGAFFPAIFPSSAGLHALTAGAIGSMTLAVMTRAILGHTGRALSADAWTAAIYAVVAIGAVLRIAAPMDLDRYGPLLWASGILWGVAFGLFAVRYGRMLLR